MIELPPLLIERDEVSEVRLGQAAREQLARDDVHRGVGIHASDLLDSRKACWDFLSPKELTDRQVFLFVIGKVLHHLVLHSLTGTEGTDSGTQEEMGILFSPDHVDGGFPRELKTNRSANEPGPDQVQEEYGHYLEQLAIYMVLMNVCRGQLWVLHINLRDASGRTFPEPRCYNVEMTPEQFTLIEAQVIETRDALMQARTERTPNLLPVCRQWKCGPKACGHWEQCRPQGRYPQTDKRRWSV